VNGRQRRAQPKPSRVSALELRVPPLALVAIFAVVMWVGARVTPQLHFVIPGRLMIAAALAALGVAVSIAGVVAFRRRGTTVNPFRPDAASAFVRTGVYRYSRNPMYLGVVLVLGGCAVLLSNVVAFACLPVFVAYMIRFQIGPEERSLSAKFGDEFSAYVKSTRRWL
jgi:protein-S-isoprenylcysteine O-methyltransferase Ste14